MSPCSVPNRFSFSITSGATGSRQSPKQLRKHARLEFLAADVIKKEQRPRADDGNVVDAMVNQIRADGVVLVHRECDFQFCADTIDTCNQNRFAHSRKVRREQAAKAADFSEDLKPVRLSNKRLNSSLKLIAEIDIHARSRVRFLFHFL